MSRAMALVLYRLRNIDDDTASFTAVLRRCAVCTPRRDRPSLPSRRRHQARAGVVGMRVGVASGTSEILVTSIAASFVPKIPSVQIMVLATAMAPSPAHRIVGLCPGEELHAIMCYANDSHLMFEFADPCMIKPSIKFTRAVDLKVNRSCGRGQPVEQDYDFSSDCNLKYIAVGEIRKFTEQEMDQA